MSIKDNAPCNIYKKPICKICKKPIKDLNKYWLCTKEDPDTGIIKFQLDICDSCMAHTLLFGSRK